ncbi:MAG TPA: glycosyltransferase family 2 protein [Flavobacteriaceae bacterium]|nr:glycosyltransferase family 2 protein [Flavobacteriaceae bacterium]
MSLFNIITPTYNRAHTIERVYSSLLNQSEKSFNWIVVDDASTDNTELLINQWQKKAFFSIKYYKLKENKGKPNAVNFGLNYCNYEYTIIADSDDSFSSNTLLDLKKIWDSINLTKNSKKISSIWTLVKNEDNNIIGDLFPKNYWQVSFKERMINSNIKGEKWHCWRTIILKEYKLYSDDECHISESVTWNRINRKYDFLCVNVVHRCYYTSIDGIILKETSRKQIAKTRYYNSYYELIDTPLSQIIKHRHYREQAFDYVKSTLFFANDEIKIVGLKKLISIIIFLGYIPSRILKKIH